MDDPPKRKCMPPDVGIAFSGLSDPYEASQRDLAPVPFAEAVVLLDVG